MIWDTGFFCLVLPRVLFWGPCFSHFTPPNSANIQMVGCHFYADDIQFDVCLYHKTETNWFEGSSGIQILTHKITVKVPSCYLPSGVQNNIGCVQASTSLHWTLYSVLPNSSNDILCNLPTFIIVECLLTIPNCLQCIEADGKNMPLCSECVTGFTASTDNRTCHSKTSETSILIICFLFISHLKK